MNHIEWVDGWSRSVSGWIIGWVLGWSSMVSVQDELLDDCISGWIVQDELHRMRIYRYELFRMKEENENIGMKWCRLHWMSIKGWITLNEWIDKVKDELWDDCE